MVERTARKEGLRILIDKEETHSEDDGTQV